MNGSQNNGLPRLGSSEAGKPSVETKVVTIPDREVTVVLRKPSVGMIIDAQGSLNPESTDVREGYQSTIGLVAEMMVEPEMTVDELKAEVDEWSFSDWQVLQEAALELAGLREEDAEKAREKFPGT